MKPQMGAQQNRDSRSQTRPSPSGIAPAVSAEELSERQRQVFECLQNAGTGLTAKQIQARVACAPRVTDDALAELVDKRLVVRLNTLVPSYLCRHSGPPAHAE
ncbi:MAG: hypothetical protein JXA87_09505 [Thermoleophilia bacterium]|nr:hypothetical protein [Thermoleophilia bacterium]